MEDELTKHIEGCNDGCTEASPGKWDYCSIGKRIADKLGEPGAKELESLMDKDKR